MPTQKEFDTLTEALERRDEQLSSAAAQLSEKTREITRLTVAHKTVLDDILRAGGVAWSPHHFADASTPSEVSWGSGARMVREADPRPPARVDELWERVVSLEREIAAVQAIASFARSRLGS